MLKAMNEHLVNLDNDGFKIMNDGTFSLLG